jgi:hypothetical protein
VEELGVLQDMAVRTVIGDPQAGRRRESQPAATARVLHRAASAVKSESGKKLLKRRGEYVERGFCQVLDHGGRRRATLRGREQLTKAYYGAIIGHNLSVLLRRQHGVGTPKQWVARGKKGIKSLTGNLTGLLRVLTSLQDVSKVKNPPWRPLVIFWRSKTQEILTLTIPLQKWSFSTGC